jgi:hydrogenase accessory protein HypB
VLRRTTDRADCASARGEPDACLNLISSPGAGKTSVLEKTLEALSSSRWRVAVLTGDIQTDRDAARLGRYGFPALQITTGGTCHLDAAMVRHALDDLPPGPLDLLFIENVATWCAWHHTTWVRMRRWWC